MKNYLLIIACLLSMSAIGQETFKIDSLIAKGGILSDSLNWTLSGQSSNYITIDTTTRITRLLNLGFYQDFKPLMKISDQKPDSTYHIWIDKKSIKWTSDSTFILKRIIKQK